MQKHTMCTSVSTYMCTSTLCSLSTRTNDGNAHKLYKKKNKAHTLGLLPKNPNHTPGQVTKAH